MRRSEDGSSKSRVSREQDVVVRNSLDPTIKSYETWTKQETISTDASGAVRYESDTVPMYLAKPLV